MKRATSASPVVARRARTPRTTTVNPRVDSETTDINTERVQNERVLSSRSLKIMVRSHAAKHEISIPMAWRDLAIAGNKFYAMEEKNG